MKKLPILLLCGLFITLLFSQCGTTSKENDQENDAIVKADSTPASVDSEVKTNALTNLTFAYGINMQSCDGLTYSEYSIDLKFGNDNTVEQTTNDIVGMGSPDAYTTKKTLMGTYAIDRDLVTIKFAKLKSESIREGKVFDSSTNPNSKAPLTLKITKCPDGRLQLISNVEGITVLGNKATEGDKGSWSLAKKK
mgnify:FL=1